MSKRILFWSLLANALLATALVWALLRGAHMAANPDPGLTAPPARAQINIRNGDTTPARDPTQAGQRDALRWSDIENDDLHTYMANLHALGLPDAIVHAIVRAEVDRRFEARFQSLSRPQVQIEFWRTGSDFDDQFVPSGDELRKRDALQAEKRDLLTALLGSDAENRVAHQLGLRERMLDSMLSFLPQDRQRAVAEILREYQALEFDLARNHQSADTRHLITDRDAAIASVLSPQEYDNYLLTLSPAAMQLRNRLVGFEPAEQEFRDIFALLRKFDAERAQRAQPDAPATGWKERRETLLSEIREVLGQVRYEDYLRAQDHRYRELYRVASAESLASSSIHAAYALLQDAAEQARSIAESGHVSDSEKNQALEELRARALADVRALWAGSDPDSAAMHRFEALLKSSTHY